MRVLLKRTDGDGMTFLMHAATGADDSTCGTGTSTANPASTSRAVPLRESAIPQPHPAPAFSGGLKAVFEEEEAKLTSGLIEEDDASHGHGLPRGASVKLELPIPRKDIVAGGGPQRPESMDEVEFLYGDGGIMDPALVVFKTAWTTVKGMLWKEQVRSDLGKGHLKRID